MSNSKWTWVLQSSIQQQREDSSGETLCPHTAGGSCVGNMNVLSERWRAHKRRRRSCSFYSPCTARSCSSVVQREFILGAGWKTWDKEDSMRAVSRLRLIRVPREAKTGGCWGDDRVDKWRRRRTTWRLRSKQMEEVNIPRWVWTSPHLQLGPASNCCWSV